jgi:hypothetical protein
MSKPRTCVATVHDDEPRPDHLCWKPATKVLRFLQVGDEPLISLTYSCDEHAGDFEECDGCLGYTEPRECDFCHKPAKWEMFLKHWDDDHDEETFAAVCVDHRKVFKENGRRRPANLKVGDTIELAPHHRVTLQETGREVLVDEDNVIFGTQGDTMTAELLVGQHVVWINDKTVRLDR